MDLAHEKWFTTESPPSDWSFLGQPQTLAAVGAAVAVAIVWRAIDRTVPRPELPFLRRLGALAPWVPRLLAVHAGVSLLAQASRGTYLAPSLRLPDGWEGTALAVVEGLTGVWLITGFRIRPAAALLVLAGPLGMTAYGVVPILERADLLGIALFLALLPPADDGGGAVRAPAADVGSGMLALRALVGTSLVVVAFTEKLVNPRLALEFLDRYPAFNIAQTLGVPMSDLNFVRLAGATELLVGLLILSGAAPQVVVLLAAVPFNATLFFLGTSELIGHLPIYGSMLALLVYGSEPAVAPTLRAFRPWRAKPVKTA